MTSVYLPGVTTPTKSLRSMAALKDLSASTPDAGGYTVVDQLHTEILQAESQLNVMRSIGRVLPPIAPGASLLVPSVETLMADADWTTELDWGDEDTSLAFGQRRLTPKGLAKWTKASKDWSRNPSFDTAAFVKDQLSQAVARPQEASFINGLGVGECLGMLNTPGLPVYTTAASNTVTADDLTNWLYGLPARYLRKPTCRILCNPAFTRKVKTMKDGVGQYVNWLALLGELGNVQWAWSDEFDDGLDGSDAWEDDAIIAVIGDFKYFWIVDAGVEIQRYIELFARTHQDGWSIRQESDAMAVLPEAFYALKVKAS